MVSFDLPGLKKEDIKINYENRLLTVSGTRKEEREGEDRQSHFQFSEKFYGSFNRSFTLPLPVNQDKISARFADGVLEFFLPKAKEGRGAEIPIQAGKRKPEFFSKSAKSEKKAV